MADPHGAVKPPHVKPRVHAVVLEIIRKLPLSKGQWSVGLDLP